MPAASRASRKRPANIDRFLAFAFGVIFVTVLLYLATVVENPSPLTIKVYITVLSLAAAGIGAILPGFLEIQFKNYLRAGGALGLGVLVYTSEPAISSNVVKWKEPAVSAEPVVSKFLSSIDKGDYDTAWEVLPELARKHVSGKKENFIELYKNTVVPLGKLNSRTLIGSSLLESPPGAPPGLYRGFSYKSKYENDAGFRGEFVGVRANGADSWEINTHQVTPFILPN